MAKQTFTTGQVLTAAQMTSLQQTAMGGGSATTKTASYTLVAADAGTTVTMTSVSATTITVNTSLFAAGDTVYIQNLGAGISTITAGTATVNTSSSLALAQYEGGQLYFTSASASIFLKGAGAAAASGGMTLLSTTTLSGTSTVVSGIDQTYTDLVLVLNKAVFGTGVNEVFMRPNGSSTLYRGSSLRNIAGSLANLAQDDTGIGLYTNYTNTGGNNVNTARISQYANTTAYKSVQFSGFCESAGGDTSNQGGGALKTNSAITSMTVATGSGYTFSSGTLLIYGVK